MPRLYTDQPLKKHATIELSDDQGHYVARVMRVKEGDTVLLFNGVDGEWQATVTAQKKSKVRLRPEDQTKDQKNESPLHLIFAPIKRGHGDFVVEKATECGVTRLTPLITHHTVVSRVPTDRYQSIAIEAAEQCERLTIPAIDQPTKLSDLLGGWVCDTPIILCAEQGDAAPIAEALKSLPPGPAALMIGPEGGFSADEFGLLRSKNYVVPVHLGPRILRADTAAITALGIIQALKGDWTGNRT